MTDHPTPPPCSAYSPGLRKRADDLAELARSIERSLVMSLTDNRSGAAVSDRRTRLCEVLLDRNLHQLHRAADDLRITAMRFRTRADELDAASRMAA